MWEIRAEHQESRYSAYIDGRRVGHAAWIKVGDAAMVPHLHVDPAYRDLSIGSELARAICRDARADGIRVLAGCPFMRRWAQLHPQYGDVVHIAGDAEMRAISPLVRTAEFLERHRLPATERA